MLNSSNPPTPPKYIGRFAPSPTGPLHLGSLLAAVASYVDAKANSGIWFVRIEDLDPPREMEGASKIILKTLENFSLFWDGSITFQNQIIRTERYESVLKKLIDQFDAFPCQCTRQSLNKKGGLHKGRCRILKPDQPFSWRLPVPSKTISFNDLCQGPQSQNLQETIGDFIIKRKDGFFAYQLAVVVDDFDQKITRIVRGADLLDSSPRQKYLQEILGFSSTEYLHFPVILGEDGHKLSKQAFSTPVSSSNPVSLLYLVLTALGQPMLPIHNFDNAEDLLKYAILHWDLSLIPKTLSISLT